uniref:Beta-hexosaminidase n=1 Tax=Parastrongyloides trichosuri TaxID=131310 RepID=A0A0N5A0H1_PARTI
MKYTQSYIIFLLINFYLIYVLTYKQNGKWLPIPTDGEIWPKPYFYNYFEERLIVSPGMIKLSFENNKNCKLFESLFNRYSEKYFFPFKIKSNGTYSISLEVKILSCPKYNEYPQIGMDESYELVINSNRTAKIVANEAWGAIKGLESFSQVITFDDKKNIYKIRTLNVIDKPRFKVRGFLIDTSRHFLPVYVIKRHLDLMSMNKMNLLHWHIVDTQSFPYQSKIYPELSNQGAFTLKHIYTRGNIQSIIEYAKTLGIVVMPEFDTPGHMGSWNGIDGLLSQCYDKDGRKSITIQPNLIDLSEKKNFDVLKSLFKEIKTLFKSSYIHLGGDEVEFWEESCWFRNPKIIQFMKNMGFGNEKKLLEEWYITQLSQIVSSVNKNWSQIYWQEVFDNSKVPDNAIVHLWKGRTKEEIYKALNNITEKGYNVIISSGWYLNYIHYGSDWKQASKIGDSVSPALYDIDIQGFNGTESQKARVIGGIAAMWGEYIDQTNIESTSWPRGSAVAEKLWSPQNETIKADDQIQRFREQRCRMIHRGYQIAPTDGPDFCLLN